MSTNGQDEEIPGLRALRREQAPERDLWPGIAERISVRRRAPRRRWFGYAAAAAIVGAVTLIIWREAPQPPSTAPAVAATPRAAQVMPQQQALLKANLAIVRDAENQLQHALELDPESESLRRLLESMKRQRGALAQRLAQET